MALSFHVKTECPYCGYKNDHFIRSYTPLGYLVPCKDCGSSYNVARKQDSYKYNVLMDKFTKNTINTNIYGQNRETTYLGVPVVLPKWKYQN